MVLLPNLLIRMKRGKEKGGRIHKLYEPLKVGSVSKTSGSTYCLLNGGVIVYTANFVSKSKCFIYYIYVLYKEILT